MERLLSVELEPARDRNGQPHCNFWPAHSWSAPGCGCSDGDSIPGKVPPSALAGEGAKAASRALGCACENLPYLIHHRASIEGDRNAIAWGIKSTIAGPQSARSL